MNAPALRRFAPELQQPTGLYGWIKSNDGRSTGLFLAFLAAMQVICAINLFLPLAILDAAHAPLLNWGGYLLRYAGPVLVASVVWFAWAMFWHVETVKRAIGFHFVDASDEPRLCRIIEPLIITMGLPVPFVGVIDSPARNAFACGIARKKAVVVVTRGLIDSLDDEELACVLGHELSHIKNGDIRLMAAANIFMTRLQQLHKNNPLQFTPIHVVAAIAIPVVLPLTLVGGFIGHAVLRAGQVLRLLIASSREFIADAEAVQLTKNPAALASALVKVEHDYRVPGARREEDAMMIAGDTEGEDATHPTVAQRIAALARTTGSMVFNAPGAMSADVWEQSPSLSEAQAAALLRKLPASKVLPRVRAGSKANVLGLTRAGMLMAVATVLSLLWIHSEELSNPRSIAAKFDSRPLAIMIGAPMSCMFGPMLSSLGENCRNANGDRAYRDFEGQKNTLAGWLADVSKQRRERGVVNADVTIANLGTEVVRRDYAGASGRMKGVKADMTAQGMFVIGNGTFSSTPPEALVIAELDQVGCYPATMFHGDPAGHWSIDEDVGDVNMRGFLANVEGSLVRRGYGSSSDEDEFLRRYVETRENLLRASFDLFGFPGYDEVRKAYRSESHDRVIEQLRARLADPALRRRLTPLEFAKHRALAMHPESFVPCIVLRKETRASDPASRSFN